MSNNNIILQINNLLKKIPELNEDKIEDIINFIEDMIDDNNNSDSDSEYSDDSDDLNTVESYVQPIPKSEQQLKLNIKKDDNINSNSISSNTIRPSTINNVSTKVTESTKVVTRPSTGNNVSTNVSVKPKEINTQKNNIVSNVNPTGTKLNDTDPSIVLKTVVNKLVNNNTNTNNNTTKFNPQTESTFQRVLNFNVDLNKEKNRTTISNFSTICSNFKIDPDIASNHLANSLKSKKALMNGMLILGGLYTKDIVESTFKSTFSKK